MEDKANNANEALQLLLGLNSYDKKTISEAFKDIISEHNRNPNYLSNDEIIHAASTAVNRALRVTLSIPSITAVEKRETLSLNKTICYANSIIASQPFNLRGADLTEANLERLNLTGADLTGAIFRGATLIHSNLSGANLSETDLTGADLRYADLTNADVRWSHIKGADFRNAIVIDTKFTVYKGKLASISDDYSSLLNIARDLTEDELNDKLQHAIRYISSSSTYDNRPKGKNLIDEIKRLSHNEDKIPDEKLSPLIYLYKSIIDGYKN
jgi:hypothetical protein